MSESDLLKHHAEELADALEEAMNVMLACVIPAGGCDDRATLRMAIEHGDAALAAAGRLRLLHPDG